MPLTLAHAQGVAHRGRYQRHAAHADHHAHHGRREQRAHVAYQRCHGQRHQCVKQCGGCHAARAVRSYQCGAKGDHERVGHMHQQRTAAPASTPGLQCGAKGHAQQRHGHHGLRAPAVKPCHACRDQHVGDEGHGRGRMLCT